MSQTGMQFVQATHVVFIRFTRTNQKIPRAPCTSRVLLETISSYTAVNTPSIKVATVAG